MINGFYSEMEKIRQANENTRSKRDKLEEDISKLSEKIKDEQVAIQLKQSEFKDAKTCAEDEKIRLERFQQEENKVRLRTNEQISNFMWAL